VENHNILAEEQGPRLASGDAASARSDPADSDRWNDGSGGHRGADYGGRAGCGVRVW
jgi:hypothetical protein